MHFAKVQTEDMWEVLQDECPGESNTFWISNFTPGLTSLWYGFGTILNVPITMESRLLN